MSLKKPPIWGSIYGTLSDQADLQAALDAKFTTTDAVADGTTKGIATFAASDFDSASGVISIDYVNGQAASASNKGFLTSTDWSTFNNKQNTISVASTLTLAVATIGLNLNSANTWTAAITMGTTTKLRFRDSTIYADSPSSGAFELVAPTTATLFASVTTLNLGSTSVTTANIATGAATANFGPQANIVIGGYGTIVFNEIGANYDERHEGDTDQNLLFLKASTDKIGIGNNSPSEKLDVTGSVNCSSSFKTGGNPLGYSVQAIASGTAYTLTTTPALIDFGTTDPSITVDKAGTYMLFARVQIYMDAVTFSTAAQLTIKIRRTNNTAADITNATTTITTGILTTLGLTETMGIYTLPVVVYVTANATDVLELWGSLDILPDSGNMNVTEASLLAVRVT